MTESSSESSVHHVVRQAYARVADRAAVANRGHSAVLGYSEEDLRGAPEEANLGLGCGNPTAGLQLREDACVLDLGSGAGMDAFVVARDLGAQGRVLGVDMTPEMIERARRNAAAVGLQDRVEFREGRIESLPVDDASVDVVVSNCVINLSPDKPQVFREAFRVLRPGGVLSVSDIVLVEALPDAVTAPAAMYVACVSGAALAKDYLAAIEAAGFVDVEVERSPARAMFESVIADPLISDAVAQLSPAVVEQALDAVWSYRVKARKP